MIYKIIFFFLWSAQVFAEQMEAETNPTKPVWPWSMAFLAQKVIDEGFKLPRPYGMGLVFYHQVQAINISDLNVGFGEGSDLRPIDFIDFGGSQVENTTWRRHPTVLQRLCYSDGTH